jgi:hypothetical protein
MFELAAWTTNPVTIPLRVWLNITDLDPSSRGSLQVVIHREQPRAKKRNGV